MTIYNMFIEEVIEAPYLSMEECLSLVNRKHPKQWWGDCYHFEIKDNYLEVTYLDMEENIEGEMYFTGFKRELPSILIY